ncbi:MAG: CDP-alcohol phosphatidyltransferase family protein [Acidimicrobiales bacterium]
MSEGARGGLAETGEPRQRPEEALDRVLTIPNVITTARLAGVGVFCWLLFGDHHQTAAAVLLAVLGASDFADGFAARRWNQVSKLGKVLDPTADRVLVATAVISVIVQGAVPLWFGVATIAREALVSVTVLVLAALGAERIDVLWVGKAGTFGLMFAYPTFLLAHGTAHWQHPFEVIAWVCGIAGLALAWIAAASYVPVARRALVAGRAARRDMMQS